MLKPKKTKEAQTGPLIDAKGARKYINSDEQLMYYKSALEQGEEDKLFALLLLLTGVRI